MQPQILVGFDFSSTSQRALDWAADLQKTLQGKPIHLVYVVNPLPIVSAPESACFPLVSAEDVADLTRCLTDAARKAGCTANVEVLQSNATGPALVAASLRLRSDLIVLGTHGRGALSRLIVGSVAEYVLRHSSIPVLTIREPVAAEVVVAASA